MREVLSFLISKSKLVWPYRLALGRKYYFCSELKYVHVMTEIRRTKIQDLLQSESFNRQVMVKGWVRTKRGNKNIAFIALNDGSVIHNIQIVVDVAGFDEELLRKNHHRLLNWCKRNAYGIGRTRAKNGNSGQ
jgi:hypothetical protein